MSFREFSVAVIMLLIAASFSAVMGASELLIASWVTALARPWALLDRACRMVLCASLILLLYAALADIRPDC